MLFHSLDYLLFLAISVGVFWTLRRWAIGRVAWLVLVSCLFYAAWSKQYLFLILGSTVLDYGIGRVLGGIDRHKTKTRKTLLGLSLLGNLGLLFAFKYFNFAAELFHDLSLLFGRPFSKPVFDVLLPVGISFYTFQTLSYTIDVYRGTLQPVRNPLKFAAFVTFFPQLVAGPIVRASEFLPQLEGKPSLRAEQVGRGLFLIALGLTKKLVFADYLSVNLVDRVFDQPLGYSATETVIALYGFTLQIYCDFSGYTDVARGSGLLMGLDLPENFDRPYQATSPADFWRRWHMTLSRWLRDYLYFPLGGSRKGEARTYANLWITLFLIGIWHGASWNFVYYGALQASAMVLHRGFVKWRERLQNKRDSRAAVFASGGGVALGDVQGFTAPEVSAGPVRAQAPRQSWWHRAAMVALCMQFVVFSRILFRAPDMDNAAAVTERLWSDTWSVAQIAPGIWLLLIAGFAFHYTPKQWMQRIEQAFVDLPTWAQAVTLVAVGWTLRLVATTEVVPYIYYQF